MKTHDCKQHSQAWYDLRLGRPTASRFDCIVTPTGKRTANAARANYLAELVGERLTRTVQQHFVTAAMERGTILEPRARAYWQMATSKEIAQVGFVTPDHGLWGCSPDGLADDCVLEIKCPLRHNLVARLIDEDYSEYIAQAQAEMWICEKTHCDLVLFSDEQGIPSRIITLDADPKMHAAFEASVPEFCAEIDAAEKTLVALGGGISPDALRDCSAEVDAWAKYEGPKP